ncbi:MAG: hypothetical protein LBI04_07470 [Treponema sp.]|jgi:hypothetical protein|nr:hypothetical protein [Treponema sp.]
MILKTDKSSHFLVFVPHRDTRRVLRNYSTGLLKAGLAGAYAFPWVAPLAALSHPLDAEELKNIARALRKAACGGKFIAEGADTSAISTAQEKIILFGPRLDFTIPPDILAGLGCDFFSPPIIGACLLSAAESRNNLPCPPKLSFTAAAVANMSWQPVNFSGEGAQAGAYGYKWKIGKLCWLPSVKSFGKL